MDRLREKLEEKYKSELKRLVARMAKANGSQRQRVLVEKQYMEKYNHL